MNILPRQGERTLIVGQTGSGKTAFACWLLARLEFGPIIIFDTKGEPKFNSFERKKIITKFDNLWKVIKNEDIDYIIYRPDYDVVGDPDLLDAQLLQIFHRLRHVVVYIDEIYMINDGPKMGMGLGALLRQGRSRGITTIISSQRPTRFDRFIISEAQRAYMFRLTDRRDRERLSDLVPNYHQYPVPPKFKFYYVELGEQDQPILMDPVPLDAGGNASYTDDVRETGAHQSPKPPMEWL